MNAEPEQPLFRPEVAEARKQRLHGDIVLSQPVGTQALALLLFGIIALLAAWVVFGEYTRAENARGILVTDDPTAKVVAVRPGIVTQLLAREGDLVRAGQRLAIVHVETAGEAGGSAIAESLTAIDVQRGLSAEQVRLAGLRARSDRARLAATLAGISQQRADLAGQINLQEQVVLSSKLTFERLLDVVEKGYLSKVEYERRRQQLLVAQQQLGQFRGQYNALTAEERRAAAELARVDADAGTEVAAARTSAESLTQQRARLRAERAYVVNAPVAGRIAAIQSSVGDSLEGGHTLMSIVPEGTRLHAEIYAPTRAIGFVRAGQEVRLLYDAFPYQRFGSFKGVITSVSRVILEPEDAHLPFKIDEPVYRIEATPDAQTVAAFGGRLPLQPGMTLTANLVLDRRSFGEWLLQPLNAVLNRNR